MGPIATVWGVSMVCTLWVSNIYFLLFFIGHPITTPSSQESEPLIHAASLQSNYYNVAFKHILLLFVSVGSNIVDVTYTK